MKKQIGGRTIDKITNRRLKKKIKVVGVAVCIVTAYILGFISGKVDNVRNEDLDINTSTYRVEYDESIGKDEFNTTIKTNIEYVEDDENCGGLHIKGKSVPLSE